MKEKGTLYKTLGEAVAAAKRYEYKHTVYPYCFAGENEYEAVMALDLYTGNFIGYTVEQK
jgi:hypothetical protein